MTEILPATAEILTEYYGKPPALSQRAYAFVRDGRCIGVFGLYVDDYRLVLFSDLTPELRRLKKTLVKGMKLIMAVARRIGAVVHAVPEAGVEGAAKLLERFGFRPADQGVYQWLP